MNGLLYKHLSETDQRANHPLKKHDLIGTSLYTKENPIIMKLKRVIRRKINIEYNFYLNAANKNGRVTPF